MCILLAGVSIITIVSLIIDDLRFKNCNKNESLCERTTTNDSNTKDIFNNSCRKNIKNLS